MDGLEGNEVEAVSCASVSVRESKVVRMEIGEGNGFKTHFINNLKCEMRGRMGTPVLLVAEMVVPLTNINGNITGRTDSISEDSEFELFLPK